MTETSRATPLDAGEFVRVHGLEQWVTLRGRSADNPILLLIPGAGAGMSVMAPFFAAWEESFTVAQWDQPMAGATYGRHGADVGEYTIDRLVRDGLAVTEHLHNRFAAVGLTARIVPLAFSGGTITGLRMVKQHPELFAAYVGTGQIVSWARQDALGYQMLLDGARASGNAKELEDLERIGPPPYADTATDAIKGLYSTAFSAAEREAFAKLDPALVATLMTPPSGVSYLPPGVTLPQDVRAVATAAYGRLRSEITSFDADRLGLDFAIPMLFLQGEHDLCTVSSEIHSYVDRMRAPRKAFVPIKGAGHSPWMMRDEFLRALVSEVYPAIGR